ncbi:MAG: hypothetical protein Q8P18_23225 [Pseudomonadota bacterium]|nr:hypothetical protein [Pseudomonadota bacterium]
MPPLPALLLILRDLGLPAVASCMVLVLASMVSKGTLHRVDRIGAASVAVGFAVGFQPLSGGGFDGGDPVTVLPLVAVVTALLAPRLVTRFAPAAAVGALVRAGLFGAGIVSAVALYALGDTRLTEVALVTVGAAIGLVVGAQVGDQQPIKLVAPDPRVGAWAVVAVLLVAVWVLGVRGAVAGA